MKRLKHTEDRVRALLVERKRKGMGGLSCSEIGARIWGMRLGAPIRKPQSYARSAGKLLRILERQGKVRRVQEFGRTDLWEAVLR
jgi:hypothetical protein